MLPLAALGSGLPSQKVAVKANLSEEHEQQPWQLTKVKAFVHERLHYHSWSYQSHESKAQRYCSRGTAELMCVRSSERNANADA